MALPAERCETCDNYEPKPIWTTPGMGVCHLNPKIAILAREPMNGKAEIFALPIMKSDTDWCRQHTTLQENQ